VRPAAGKETNPLARRISRRWYAIPANDRGIEAVALDLNRRSPALLVRTAAGETRTPLGVGRWEKSRDTFTDGLGRILSVPPHPLVAASGAWTADDVFTVKLVLYETPYAATLAFHYDGDRLLLDSEYNVSFGPTKQPELTGQAIR
jgi:hypothetical protein